MENIGQKGNDGLHYQEEFDEDHALDMVLNDMVKDMEVVDEEEVIDALKNIDVKDAEELKTSEEFIKEVDKIEKAKNSGSYIAIKETPTQYQIVLPTGALKWVDKKGLDSNKIRYM